MQQKQPPIRASVSALTQAAQRGHHIDMTSIFFLLILLFHSFTHHMSSNCRWLGAHVANCCERAGVLGLGIGVLVFCLGTH